MNTQILPLTLTSRLITPKEKEQKLKLQEDRCYEGVRVIFRLGLWFGMSRVWIGVNLDAVSTRVRVMAEVTVTPWCRPGPGPRPEPEPGLDVKGRKGTWPSPRPGP